MDQGDVDLQLVRRTSVLAPFTAAGARVCVRMRSRREQGEQRDGDEVAERGLWPANLSSTVEPGGVDEEDDGRDHDLAEPADDEEQRREHDAPEAELWQADRGAQS